MARKDVELVIRARDEAKKSLNSLTDALERFVGQQLSVRQAANTTGDALDKLGKTLVNLESDMDAKGAAAKIVSELGKAQAAVNSLTVALQESEEDFARVGARAEAAARETAKFRDEAEKSKEALAAQSAALARAKDAQASLNAALANGASDRKKLAEADRRLTAAIEEQRLKMALARGAMQQLGDAILKAEAPTKRMVNAYRAASVGVRAAATELEALRSTQGAVREALTRTDRQVEEARVSYRALAASVNEYAARARAAAGGLDAANERVAQAAEIERELATALRKSEAARDSNAAGLAAATAEMQKAIAVGEEYKQLLASTQARSQGNTNAVYQQQAQVFKALREEQREVAANYARLSAAMKATQAPSAALQAEFAITESRLTGLAQQTRVQADYLLQMRAAVRAANPDFETFRANQTALYVAGFRAAKALKEYAAETGNVAQRTARMAAEIARSEEAMRRQEAAARKAREAYMDVDDLGGRAGAAARRAADGTEDLFGTTARLRQEVISTIIAYTGLFAAFNGIRSVLAAQQRLEASQSRLTASFGEGNDAVANELDFIRRNANRLGIEFGLLAEQYSRFSAATKGTSIAGQATRDIFIQVAEAARVQKLSMEDTNGVFKALEQIASKGKFSLEELGQQLGDRLPGAVQILADALNVGTAELFKMIEAGNVSSAELAAFGDELEKRFGPSLAQSLLTSTTAIGRFQNALYQTLITFGDSGFIDGFIKLTNAAADSLASAEFQSFAANVSSALESVALVMARVVDNGELVVGTLGFFVALPVISFSLSLAKSLFGAAAGAFGLGKAFTELVAIFKVGAVGLSTITGGLARTVAVARILTVAIGALASSIGVGLFALLASTVVTSWAFQIDTATDAATRHRDAIDQIRNAYDKLGGDLGKVREEIKDLSVTELEAGLAAANKNLRETQEEMADLASLAREVPEKLRDAQEAFANGGLSGDALVRLIDEMLKAKEITLATAENIMKLAKRGKEAEKQVLDFANALKVKTGAAGEAEAALGRLANRLEDRSARTAESDALAYKNALAGIKAEIPELTKEIERLGKLDALKKLLEDAVKFAASMTDVTNAIKAYNDATRPLRDEKALKPFEGSSDGRTAAAVLLRAKEGFRSEAYYDSNAYRVGYGSDQQTKRGGEIVTVFKGMITTLEDAERDLARRILEFEEKVVGKIGAERYESFGKEQQAVLISLAYNYGNLPDRIASAIKTGTVDQIAAAIELLAKDNAKPGEEFGPNRGRREEEAAIFRAGGQTPSVEPYIDAAVKVREEQEKAAEAAEKARAATEKRMAELRQELEVETLRTFGMDMQADIILAQQKAIEENKDISEDDLGLIELRVQEFHRLKAIAKELADAEEARQEREKQFQATNDSIKNYEQELRLLGLKLQGKETEAEIEEAIAALRAENPNLDANGPEIERVRELIALRKQATDALDAQKEAAKKAEEQAKYTAELRAEVEALKEQQTIQALLNAGLDRQAFIREGINAKKKEGLVMDDKILVQLGEQLGRLYDLENVNKAAEDRKKAIEEQEKRINDLLALRSALQDQYLATQERGGDSGALARIAQGIDEVNVQLVAAIDNAIAFIEALGAADPATLALIARLRAVREASKESTGGIVIDMKQVATTFANTATNAVTGFFEEVAEGVPIAEAAKNAFLSFAAEFLRSIAQMILQQLFLNAIRGALGLPGAPGAPAATGHTGGRVGRGRIGGNPTRSIDPAVFASAIRYHEGGVVGLKPGEVPAILKEGEEVLTDADPRHMANGGGAASGGDVRVVNAIDSVSFLEEAMRTRQGERIVLNFIRANSASVKAVLGV